jgi:hypothetical protein
VLFFISERTTNMDFRGYLNQAAQKGDKFAGYMLGYVGNDGKVDPTKQGYETQSGSYLGGNDNVSKVQNDVNQYYGAYQKASGATQGAYYGGSGAASGPTAAEKAQQASFINKSYDTKIGGLRSILDTLNPQEDAAKGNVNNQYGTQAKIVTDQKDMGERNLNMATEQVQAGKVKSLADLTRQIQQLGMSYNNQLGQYGAGDSSAAQLIQRGLSGQASKNRSDVLYNTNNQQRGIDMKMEDLHVDFGNQMKTLDDWKASTLNDIATKFLQQRQQIQQQMANADGDRYTALAQLDSNYVNQAIQALGNLESTYRSNANQLISQYQSIASPKAGLNGSNLNYEVAPISAGQVGKMNIPSASAGNQPTALANRRPFDEDFGFGLGV